MTVIEDTDYPSTVARTAKQAVRAGWVVEVDHTEGSRVGISGQPLAERAEGWTLRGRRDGLHFVALWTRDWPYEQTKIKRDCCYVWSGETPLRRVTATSLTRYLKEGLDALG